VLYAGYLVLGLAVLAKGLIGFALPGLIFLLYFLVTWDWRLLKRFRVVRGGLLALLVAAPWYLTLSILSWTRNLLDDESKTFAGRFFLHDHLYRLGSGVHGDRGTFAYFIEQLGLGAQPWFPFMVWGTARSAGRVDRADLSREGRVELLCFLWAVAGFGLYSLSMTKFHHYALPVLPALAILAALWLTRWAEQPQGVGRWAVPLCLVLGVVLISRDIGLTPKAMVDLFVYNYTRDFPKEAALPGQIGFAVVYGLTATGLAALFLWGRGLLARWARLLLVAGGILGAVWSGWFFFTSLGPHWSQKHLFETYYALKGPADPLGAYLMNWRGETFYSGNRVVQIKSNARLKSWLDEHPGQRVFLLVETGRLDKLKEQLGAQIKSTLRVLDRSCNKFYLVSVEVPVEKPPAPAVPPPQGPEEPESDQLKPETAPGR
jgi:4-amino-4-deoxy-L-arabinose transferase-like glycosyltransferase